MNEITGDILVSAGTSFATALATKGTDGPAQTLDDVWELVFGGFHLYVDKKRAKRSKQLEDYKNRIAKGIVEIPTENIQEPALNIIGPALEASKYYIEEEVIRDIFAKLIASSFDDRKTSQTHSAYVEIIKQLSTLDAKNLIYIKGDNRPIVEYQFINEGGLNKVIIATNIFLTDRDGEDIEQNSISISNLNRLGLINILYDEYLTDEIIYSKYKLSQYYYDLKAKSEQRKLKGEEYCNLDITKGIVNLTPMGKSFIKICL